MMNSNLRRTPFVTAWIAGGLASLIMTMSALGQFIVTQPAGITMSSDATASTSKPAAATPYPSEIGVTNVLGAIEKVAVTLSGLTHNYPFGLNVVLVSPAGKQVLLMSHTGGAGSLSGVILNFDDGASGSLPQASPSSQIVSGTFKPSAYSPTITTTPAPLTGTFGTALSAVTGDNPNGKWQLFVFDDAALDTGSLVSWSLNLWTTPTIVATTPSGTATNHFYTTENAPVTINLTLNSSSTPLNNLTVSGVCENKSLVSDTNIVAGGTGAARTLLITPNLNAFGTNKITITAKDGDLGSTNIDVTLDVKFVNQPPTISLATNRVSTVAGVLTTNVTVTLTDVDSPAGNLSLSASSSNSSAVAGTNVFFAGTGLTRTMTIAPNGAGTGSATLTSRVVDDLEPTRLLTNSTTIDVTVNQVNYAVFANPNAVIINDADQATPYPSTVVVSNVTVNGQVALIGRLTVVLADVTHGRPEDVSVLLEGPQGQKAPFPTRPKSQPVRINPLTMVQGL